MLNCTQSEYLIFFKGYGRLARFLICAIGTVSYVIQNFKVYSLREIETAIILSIPLFLYLCDIVTIVHSGEGLLLHGLLGGFEHFRLAPDQSRGIFHSSVLLGCEWGCLRDGLIVGTFGKIGLLDSLLVGFPPAVAANTHIRMPHLFIIRLSLLPHFLELLSPRL
jgi:hypothetical protein